MARPRKNKKVEEEVVKTPEETVVFQAP